MKHLKQKKKQTNKKEQEDKKKIEIQHQENKLSNNGDCFVDDGDDGEIMI